MKGEIVTKNDIIKLCKKRQTKASYFAGLGGILERAKIGRDIAEEFNRLNPIERRILIHHLNLSFGQDKIAKMIKRNVERVRTLLGKCDNDGSNKWKEKKRKYWEEHKHTVQQNGRISVLHVYYNI